MARPILHSHMVIPVLYGHIYAAQPCCVAIPTLCAMPIVKAMRLLFCSGICSFTAAFTDEQKTGGVVPRRMLPAGGYWKRLRVMARLS